MKRSIPAAITVAAIIMVLAAAASAVEVKVKTDTTLYGKDGKAVRQVAAGQSFKAERRHETWVWGFLQTPGGGARGWIKLADLEVDDDAMRKLDAAAAGTSTTTRPTRPIGPTTTTPTTPTTPTTTTTPTTPTVTHDETPTGDAVVLRYRLKQRELQVYEASQEMNMEFGAGAETMGMKGTVTQSLHLKYSVQGTRLAADGTTVADIRFHALKYEQESVVGNGSTRVEGDENGATLYRNGKRVYSGKWGSSKLVGVPDFSRCLNTTYTVHFTDRGEVRLDATAKSIGAIDLKDMLGGDCVFPEEPVRPGMSWTADVGSEFGNPAEPGAEIPMVGQAKYTVLGRTVHRNRRCIKIGTEIEMKEGEAPAGVQMSATGKGVSYVDEATGIRLDSQLDVSLNMTGSVMGSQMRATGSGKLVVSYKGNRLNN
jgi:hypothetical protein